MAWLPSYRKIKEIHPLHEIYYVESQAASGIWRGAVGSIVKDHTVLGFSIQQEKCGWAYRNLCETNTLYSSNTEPPKVKGQWEVWPRTCLPPTLAHTCLKSIALYCIPESLATLATETQPGSLSEPIPGTAWCIVQTHWPLSTLYSYKHLHVEHCSLFLEMLPGHVHEVDIFQNPPLKLSLKKMADPHSVVSALWLDIFCSFTNMASLSAIIIPYW